MKESEFGVRLLSEGIIQGGLSNDGVILHAYGHYLSQGGSHKDFEQLTMDDIQIMYAVMESERIRDANLILESLAKMLGAEKVR